MPKKNIKNEKPNSFNSSIKRLIKELSKYKKIIVVAIILAGLSSILSIVSPNMLSKLTNEIQKGLIINSKNMKTISNNINKNVTNKEIYNDIIKFDTNKAISLMNNNEIAIFMNEIKNNPSNFFIEFDKLSNENKELLLDDSKYEDILITKKEKIDFIKKLNNKDFNYSKNINKVVYKDFTVDNKKITSKDQVKFLTIMSSMKDSKKSKKLYSKLDELPDNIKVVISPNMNIDKIKSISIFIALLYIFSALSNYIQSLIMTIVSNRFARNLRERISIKINNLPLKFFDKNQSGDILSRMTNDVDTIQQTMNQSLGSLVSSLTLFIGTIIMMFYTNYQMALTAILSSLIGFIFMGLILSKSQKYFNQRQESLGKLNSHIEEIYSGLKVVKAYNAKEDSLNKFTKLNKEVYDANRKSQFLSGIMMPMMFFIGNLGYVCVCIVGAILTTKDIISFGTIVAFILYVRLFTSPLSQIAQGLTSMQSTAAASERVFAFLDERNMKSEKDLKGNIKDVKGNIEFKNVYFSYNKKSDPIINNFSVKVKKGEKVAIVGPTGSGKTTLVNLLMKFYDIDSGDIIIDNVSIKDLKRENVHSLFTMVLQDTWLFEGSIRDNLTFGKDNIKDEDIVKVCKEVKLHHFIKSLPKGYDTIIKDDDNISQGQRQLLTIARAMLNDTPFVILDEATSNVDTRTEELVQESMDKLSKGKTSFIIAHRLSTIKNADKIIVMKDGKIIEEGNHNELMKKNGFYADLYNSQFIL